MKRGADDGEPRRQPARLGPGGGGGHLGAVRGGPGDAPSSGRAHRGGDAAPGAGGGDLAGVLRPRHLSVALRRRGGGCGLRPHPGRHEPHLLRGDLPHPAGGGGHRRVRRPLAVTIFGSASPDRPVVGLAGRRRGGSAHHRRRPPPQPGGRGHGSCWPAGVGAATSSSARRRGGGSRSFRVGPGHGGLGFGGPPIGLATAGRAMLHPSAIGIGATVALLSSVLPYSLELFALAASRSGPSGSCSRSTRRWRPWWA